MRFVKKEGDMQKTKIVKSLSVGALVGAVNALFGGGGGMLAVPALRGLGLDEKRSHATAILVVLPVSALSFLWYAISGNCDVSVLLPTSIGTLIGGVVGAKLLGKLPVKVVTIIFAALQAFAGGWMLFFKG